MHTDKPGSRRRFLSTLLAGALGSAAVVLAALRAAGHAQRPAGPDSGGGHGTDARTSDELLATMNDLSGILER